MPPSREVTGAWLMHHDQKLTGVQSTEFESIATAGRAARLLSYISRELQWSVSHERVCVLANVNGIRKHEVDGLLNELAKAGVVDVAEGGVSVLGVNQSDLFKHATDVFESQNPAPMELAAIDIAEQVSVSPIDEGEIAKEIADNHKLSFSETSDLFNLSKTIGFVDHEAARDKTLLFNGSLFKRGDAEKTAIILDGLRSDERQRLLEVTGRFSLGGCLLEDEIVGLLGEPLWQRLHPIGLFQVSQVTNEIGSTRFVTRPSALIKYVPGGLADMHDDAKALASSLTYGILRSNRVRGKILTPARLIEVLIGRGYVEGWAEAIKQDYVTVERRGVVQTSTSSNGHRLTLLKPEIGIMAQDLILKGDANEAAARAQLGRNATEYHGPEDARVAARLISVPETRRAASKALDSLRKTR